MVAVAILALAAFGIFQAFSAGFMGMTESKARTIATNFVQEKMEELKNKDFDEVVDISAETMTSGGIEFTRYINVDFIDGTTNLVSAEPTNIKRIINTVNWSIHDKNQTVQSQLLIQETQFTPGDANRLVLFADPYNVVLPVTDNTDIIAVIKDEDGNTITDWDGSDITFTIIDGSDLGTLSTYAVTPDSNTGIARVTFTSTGTGSDAAEGVVKIQASVTRPDLTILTNTININVTWGAVKIEVTADPTSIRADGTSISNITAEIQRADGSTATGGTFDVTFMVSGQGTLIGDNTVTASSENGYIVIIQLQSTTTPGIAVVSATSPDLFSDSCDVQTSGIPAGVSIQAVPEVIYDDDTADIIVKIVDVNGIPVIPTETITVSLNISGDGNLFDLNGNLVNLLEFNSVHTIEVRYSPSPDIGTERDVTISASTVDWSDSVLVNVLPKLIPDHIVLQANPANIPVGGGSSGTTKITAIVKDSNEKTVHNYSGSVNFIASMGTLSASSVPCNQGIAEVYLESGSITGFATVDAVTYYDATELSSSLEVGFYSTAHHIALDADPSAIPVGGGSAGTSKLTAYIKDIDGVTVENYDGKIEFSFDQGFGSTAEFKYVSNPNYTVPVFKGKASIDIESLQNSGNAELTAAVNEGDSATSGGTIVYIQKVLQGPVMDSVEYIEYSANKKGVTCDVEVLGGDLPIVEMMISWSPDDDGAVLLSIELNGSDVTADVLPEQMLNGNTIDITDTDLLTGTSPVTLAFDQGITDKDIIIDFVPSSSNYHMNGYTVNIDKQ
ncbi:MAG: hypothetical protein JXB49_22180 [Bacteroidales bacterium]|nr:hypothetical protein [Bacteroidales bacterium]